jgi:hypothetical protein
MQPYNNASFSGLSKNYKERYRAYKPKKAAMPCFEWLITQNEGIIAYFLVMVKKFQGVGFK